MVDGSTRCYNDKVHAKLKRKLCITVVRPAMMYGSEIECWTPGKQDEQHLHTTEMKILRWSQGRTIRDGIRNEIIRGNA